MFLFSSPNGKQQAPQRKRDKSHLSGTPQSELKDTNSRRSYQLRPPQQAGYGHSDLTFVRDHELNQSPHQWFRQPQFQQAYPPQQHPYCFSRRNQSTEFIAPYLESLYQSNSQDVTIDIDRRFNSMFLPACVTPRDEVSTSTGTTGTSSISDTLNTTSNFNEFRAGVVFVILKR